MTAHDISKISRSAAESIKRTQTPADLEALRIQYLGRKGKLTGVLRSLKNLPPEEKKQVGAEANKLQKEISELLDQKEQELKNVSPGLDLKKEWLDVTRPGTRRGRGHVHPITRVTQEVMDIFSRMGFETIEGPEVETEWYNFDALNIPADHPARDMWDTFWLQSNQKFSISNFQFSNKSKIQNSKPQRLLLRTHTSPVQVRYMEKHNPPIRIIIPGRVYRYEATDASHDIQFHQVEGLMVDKDISIANFKATIKTFFSNFFKKDIAIRLRPSYFPFTEPSFEVDISCVVCNKKGCSVCKKSGWLEIAGAGMVHPNVFKAVGYIPKTVQGFAFGLGLTRIAMMKYKIPDIRLFHSGDLRFLTQF